MIGHKKSQPKIAYASVLFGRTPQETLKIASEIKQKKFKAVKFGWQDFGLDLDNDRDHLIAAREGLDKETMLMVDVGAIWGSNIEKALSRSGILKEANITWLEEPFYSDAFYEYSQLAKKSSLPLAGGESCHSVESAKNMMRYGGVSFIQIDAGIVGGILAGKEICDYAENNNIQYVNHTFTSHLQLSSSIQPYAGSIKSTLAEYPMQLKSLAWDINNNHILVNDRGELELPDKVGHGMEINLDSLIKYKVGVNIQIDKKRIF